MSPLGRVFCGACGAKLDLSAMTTDNVASMTHRSFFSLRALKFLWVILIPPVLMAGLALWPAPAPIGKAGSLIGTQRVERSLQTFVSLKKGRTLGSEFKEEDINGYFNSDMAAKLGATSVSMQVFEGYLQVHVVRTMKLLKLGSFVFSPPVSYDFFCVPAGSMLRMPKVSMGHLTWLGPFKTSLVRSLYGTAAANQDWAVLSDTSEITFEPGKVTLVLTKP
jgi:hypothetical protein